MSLASKLFCILLCFPVLAACDPLYTGLKRDYLTSSLASKILLNRIAQNRLQHDRATIWIAPEDFPVEKLEEIGAYVEPLGDGRVSLWINCVAETQFGTAGSGTTADCSGTIHFPEQTLHVNIVWSKHGSVWKLTGLQLVPLL